MHARIVRFTDVTAEAVERVKAEVEASEGPPPGVESTGMKLFYDGEQGTAIFVGFFATAEAMTAADQVFEAMDPSETPGTRASVDRCEVVVDADA